MTKPESVHRQLQASATIRGSAHGVTKHQGVYVLWLDRSARVCLKVGIAGPRQGKGLQDRLRLHYAYYQDAAAVFAIDSVECIGGSLARTQQRLVEAWAEIHLEELRRDWDLLQSGQPPIKIEPLK